MREFGFPRLAGGLVVVEANAAGLQAGLDLEGLAVGVHFFALLEEVVEGDPVPTGDDQDAAEHGTSRTIYLDVLVTIVSIA